MPLICASILDDSVKGYTDAVGDLEADIIEVRADGLKECSSETVHQLLSEIKKITQKKIILTVRNRVEGGFFKGSEESRKEVVLGSLHLADMVDIELQAQIRYEIVSKARANGVEAIVSHHDFEKTPHTQEITTIIRKEMEAGADICKVAFKPNSTQDVLRLLNITQDWSKETKIITISMGELGRISRITAPFFGSAFTYASASETGESGPGQLSVKETKKIFQILEGRQ